jgi:hypothetical protein
MSPTIEMFLDNFKNPEYLYDLQQEEYLDQYRNRVRELSRIDEARQVIELMSATDGITEAKSRLQATRAVHEQGQKLLNTEMNRRAQERQYLYTLLSREFTDKFHDTLADQMLNHPDTMKALMDKVEMADLYQDTEGKMEANLEAYTWVMSYLNNFNLEEYPDDHPDLETFLAHREFGLKEATRLLTDIRLMKTKRFIVEAERADVYIRWGQLEFPVKNINGTIHRKVKRSTGSI